MAFEPGARVFDDIAPHPDGVDPASELIHERAYVVRAYRHAADRLVFRGSVRDQKPPGFVPDDPDPLTVHHMIVDLHITMPSLEIVQARALLDVHPYSGCTRIEEHYDQLVGLSIARGFTHRVRELFGGPRGCTHTTALLQAMAPVAIQSAWSFRVADATAGDATQFGSPEHRDQIIARNFNSCHVWADDGEQVRSIRAGDPLEAPVSVRQRMEHLGVDPEWWRRRTAP